MQLASSAWIYRHTHRNFQGTKSTGQFCSTAAAAMHYRASMFPCYLVTIAYPLAVSRCIFQWLCGCSLCETWLVLLIYFSVDDVIKVIWQLKVTLFSLMKSLIALGNRPILVFCIPACGRSCGGIFSYFRINWASYLFVILLQILGKPYE